MWIRSIQTLRYLKDNPPSGTVRMSTGGGVDSNGWLTSFTVTGTSTYNLANAAYFRLSANLIDSTSAIYVD